MREREVYKNTTIVYVLACVGNEMVGLDVLVFAIFANGGVVAAYELVQQIKARKESAAHFIRV